VRSWSTSWSCCSFSRRGSGWIASSSSLVRLSLTTSSARVYKSPDRLVASQSDRTVLRAWENILLRCMLLGYFAESTANQAFGCAYPYRCLMRMGRISLLLSESPGFMFNLVQHLVHNYNHKYCPFLWVGSGVHALHSQLGTRRLRS
jgi:hypothetical protein